MLQRGVTPTAAGGDAHLAHTLAFNKKAIEDKIKRLSAYIGLKPNFRAFMDFVLQLREETGVPHTLAGLKVGPEKADMIVDMAPKDPTAGGNPVPLDKRIASPPMLSTSRS